MAEIETNPREKKASVRFFSLPEMAQVEAVCGTNVKSEFSRHVHGTYTLGIVRRGAREIVREGETVLIPENAVFVVNPGTWHACRSLGDDGCGYSVLSVGEALMRRLASQISEKAMPAPFFRNTLVFDEEIAISIHRFFALLDEPEMRLARESQLVALFSKLILRHGEDPPGPCRVGRQRKAVERVEEYISANYKESISLEKLSNVACLSPFHLQRVFRKDKGISPHEYLMQLRIKESRELLREMGILDVALELGFTDHSHVSRFFKRHTGVPPGRYVSMNVRS